MRRLRGATNEDSGAYLSEEQRSSRSKMSLPRTDGAGADRFCGATASRVAYVPKYAALRVPCFAAKSVSQMCQLFPNGS